MIEFSLSFRAVSVKLRRENENGSGLAETGLQWYIFREEGCTMQKQVESMDERELLEELVRQGQRREKAELVKIGILAALLLTIVVLAIVLIPKILTPMQQIGQSMEQVEEAAKEAERILSSIDENTTDQLKQAIEGLNEATQQIRAMVDKLRDSGFDKLQSTIEGLNESLDAFLKFFSR